MISDKRTAPSSFSESLVRSGGSHSCICVRAHEPTRTRFRKRRSDAAICRLNYGACALVHNRDLKLLHNCAFSSFCLHLLTGFWKHTFPILSFFFPVK